MCRQTENIVQSSYRRAIAKLTLAMALLVSVQKDLNAADIQEFEAVPKNVREGQSSVLKWRTREATKIYLSGFGLVDARGDLKIKPDTTTTYALVAEGKSGIAIRIIRVVVDGTSKAGWVTPDPTIYRYPIRGICQVSFAQTLDKVHRTLQDSMGFSVQPLFASPGIDWNPNHIQFITSLQSQSDLPQPSPPIGGRRISFLVDIEASNSAKKPCSYTISILIEYRRRGERTWRPEGDDALYKKAAFSLKSRIDK